MYSTQELGHFEGRVPIKHMVTEELAFSGSHQMSAGAVVKWVPLSQGHCAGYDGPEFGGILGVGIDGWGTVVTSVTLNSGSSPYALCTKEEGAPDFTFQSHVTAVVLFEPPLPPPPPASPPPPSSPNMGIVVREWVVSTALPWLGVALLLAVAAAGVLYVTAAQSDPNKFQKLVEEGATATATATAEFTSTTAKTLTAVVDWTKLSPDGRAPIRNLSADLAEEARIKGSVAASPPPSRRSPPPTFRTRFVHSFSQAPRTFQPMEMVLPCLCFFIVFGITFYGLVLAPALSFGIDVFIG